MKLLWTIVFVMYAYTHDFDVYMCREMAHADLRITQWDRDRKLGL